MLTYDQILAELGTTNKTQTRRFKRFTDVYYSMTLHTTGARPMFQSPAGQWIMPPNYFGEHYQYLFNHFLLNKHPRESLITRNWRLSVYRPFTQAPFLQVIGVVAGAIFQDSNYSIRLPNPKDDAYLWENAFAGRDIIQYFKLHLKAICEDPNGAFIVMPDRPGHEYATTDEIAPTINFIPSKNIRFLSNDEIIYEDEYDCNVVWVVNKVSVLRFQKQQGRGRNAWALMDNEDGQGGYYAHELGYLPVYVAGGVWNRNGGGFFESWLVRALAAADEYISSASSEQHIDKEASNPWITQVWQDCPDCPQSCGYFPDTDHLGNPCRKACEKCNGEGRISQNPGDRLNATAEEMANGELIKITNPDVAINTYHHEKNKDVLNLILDALNLLYVTEAQSGVAKTIDRDRLYQFIKEISDDVFGRLIYNCVKDVIALRNTTVQGGVTRPYVYQFTFITPSQFQILTASELLADLKLATDSGVPAYIRAENIAEYVDKKFNGDAVLGKKTTFIKQADALMSLSETEKGERLTAGGCDARDIKYSGFLPVILDQIIRERTPETFLQMTYDQIKASVDEIFAKMMPAAPKLPTYAA